MVVSVLNQFNSRNLKLCDSIEIISSRRSTKIGMKRNQFAAINVNFLFSSVISSVFQYLISIDLF